MATYNPPAFPRRPKQSNILSEARYQLQLNYYRYQISTAQYVMSPGEKAAYNVVVLSVFVLFFSAVYYYLPAAAYLSVDRLAYYFTGTTKLHVTHLVASDVLLPRSREAMASLADQAAILNASVPFAP